MHKCNAQMNKLCFSMHIGLLHGLTNLRTLDVDSNPSDIIDDFAFAELPNVTYINLYDCRLKTIKRNMFAGLYSLETLKLTDCRITAIEDYSFRDLRKLTLLRLEDTELETLSPAIFDAANLPSALTIKFSDAWDYNKEFICDDRVCWLNQVGVTLGATLSSNAFLSTA